MGKKQTTTVTPEKNNVSFKTIAFMRALKIKKTNQDSNAKQLAVVWKPK